MLSLKMLQNPGLLCIMSLKNAVTGNPGFSFILLNLKADSRIFVHAVPKNAVNFQDVCA